MPDSLKLRSLAVTMADDPAVRRTLERIRDGFTEVVGEAARGSQANGRLRADVDTDHVVGLFAGLSFLGAFSARWAATRAPPARPARRDPPHLLATIPRPEARMTAATRGTSG